MGFSITKEEYEELLKCSERIEAVKRLITYSSYVSSEQILLVLGIKMPVKTEGGEK